MIHRISYGLLDYLRPLGEARRFQWRRGKEVYVAVHLSGTGELKGEIIHGRLAGLVKDRVILDQAGNWSGHPFLAVCAANTWEEAETRPEVNKSPLDANPETIFVGLESVRRRLDDHDR